MLLTEPQIPTNIPIPTKLKPKLKATEMSDDQYQARTLPQVVAEAAATYGQRIAITDGDRRSWHLFVDYRYLLGSYE